MRLIEIRDYGATDELQLVSREGGLELGHRQILVSVKAASYNPVDTALREGLFDPGSARSFPQSQGQDWSGLVEAVGDDVEHFKVGDEVYGCQSAANIHGDGAWAEKMRVELEHLAIKPVAFSWEQAAALPLVGLTALQALRDEGGLEPDRQMRVFINGASGGVGHLAVQLAQCLGADYIAGSASPKNHDVVRDLGADAVLDYNGLTLDDYPGKFDIFFDAAAKTEFSQIRDVLTETGIYIRTRPTAESVATSAATKVAGLVGYDKRAKVIWMNPNSSDLALLARLVDQHRLKVLVARTFPFENYREFVEAGENSTEPGKYILRVSC